MISFKQLVYALAVEKHLHFKKAAESCHVSQSALSTALNELEKQLGLLIFERDNKKVLVTPIGQEVLDRARKIVAEVNDLQLMADSQDSPLAYPMSVGVIPTIAPYLLPRLLPQINKQYPNAQLKVLEEQSHVLVEKVRSGEIDTAILALPYPCDGLLTLDFWEEDFYWVAHCDDEHANQPEISSDELDQQNLMLLSEGHCLKDHILDACRFKQQSLQGHALGATSLNTLLQMVQGGLGSTLVPAMALDQLVSKNPSLCASHLNEPGPHRRIAFIIRPNYTRMAGVELLMDLCRQGLEQG